MFSAAIFPHHALSRALVITEGPQDILPLNALLAGIGPFRSHSWVITLDFESATDNYSAMTSDDRMRVKLEARVSLHSVISWDKGRPIRQANEAAIVTAVKKLGLLNQREASSAVARLALAETAKKSVIKLDKRKRMPGVVAPLLDGESGASEG